MASIMMRRATSTWLVSPAVNIFPAGYANKATGVANWDGFLLVFSPSQAVNNASQRIIDRDLVTEKHPR